MSRLVVALAASLACACSAASPLAPTASSMASTVRADAAAPYLALGDSITSGNRAPEPSWTLALQAHAHSGSFTNAAVGGSTTDDMLRRLPSDLAAFSGSVVFIFGGTNDFHYYQAAVSAVVGNVDQMAQQIQQAGKLPVIIGPIPRDFSADVSPDLETRELSDYRIALSTYAAQHRFPAVDPWTALADPQNPSRINPAYTIDGIHPNEAGSVVLAQTVATAIGWPWR